MASTSSERDMKLAMLFAEHAGEKERSDPEWTVSLFHSFVRHCGSDAGPERTAAARETDASMVSLYGAPLEAFTRINSGIAVDLQALRANWEKTRPIAGLKRFDVFDRCVTSRSVRELPHCEGQEEEGFKLCEFSGVASTQTRVYAFGHPPTDRVPELHARIDRQCFYYVVRPLMAYAHFVSHMASHAECYPNFTDDQRARQYAGELRELKQFIITLFRENPATLEKF